MEKSTPSGGKWRKIAIATSAIALLLAVGLGVVLSVFLVKTECGPPPTHDLATTSYSGTAEAGSQVTYVCPRPYVFPNDMETFTLRCTDKLDWNMTEVPPCSRQAEKQCVGLVQDEHFDLSLDIEDNISSLQVKLTLTGQAPSALLVDLNSNEERKCSYGGAEMSDEAKFKRFPVALRRNALREVQPIQSITITDSIVDPGVPYQIRIRGSGELVAVSLVQNDYLNITLHSLSAKSVLSPESPARGSRFSGPMGWFSNI